MNPAAQPSCLLSTLVESLGGELDGEDVAVERLSPVETALAGSLTFVSHARFASQLATTQASAVIVSPAMADQARHIAGRIVTDDVYHYFARLTQYWKQFAAPVFDVSGSHSSAVVASTAQIGCDVSIGAFCVVGEHAVIGDGVRLGAHSVVGPHAEVGAQTHFHPRVTLLDRCVVGQRCVVHSGVVIGADGFGFAPHDGVWVKIEQLGRVVIGDDVEIGANSCIDRGALEDTVLGNGVKLDNLVQIGHNVTVGDHSAMAGCVGVAGSAVIGAYCTVGGGAVVLGHLKLADHVHISAASVVTRSMPKPGHYSGVFPLDDNAAWEKNAATLKQLHALRDRIKKLEKS